MHKPWIKSADTRFAALALIYGPPNFDWVERDTMRGFVPIAFIRALRHCFERTDLKHQSLVLMAREFTDWYQQQEKISCPTSSD